MSNIIQIGDVQLHRFPDNGCLPLEDCYQMCEDAGLVVASAKDLALLRIKHNGPHFFNAWSKIKGATNTIVGTCLLEGKPTIVVAHAKHPLMTAEAIAKFKKDPKTYVNNAILIPEQVIIDFIGPYRNSTEKVRDVWVIQGKEGISLSSGFVPATVEATRRTLLRPFIGSNADENVIKYFKGYFRPNIAVVFNKKLNNNPFFFNHLVIGVNYYYVPSHRYYENDCVFGMLSSTQKTLTELL